MAVCVVAALLLTGCVLVPRVLIPTPTAPTPTLPPVPSMCGNGDAQCQKSGQVRWVVDLAMPVGVQITMAAGHIVWVAPYKCPDGVETPNWDCKIDVQWRFAPDSRTVWVVSNGNAFGVDAAAGAVPEWYRPWTTEEVLGFPVYEQEITEMSPPSSTVDGLVGTSASQAEFTLNDPKDHLMMQVRIGCVKGSEKDIPGVSVSHGAPDWAQICTQPVLYAINY